MSFPLLPRRGASARPASHQSIPPPPRNQRRSTHRPRIRTHDRLISHTGDRATRGHGERNPHARRARADHGGVGPEDRPIPPQSPRPHGNGRQAGRAAESTTAGRNRETPPRPASPPPCVGASNAGVVAGELELARASDLHIHDAPPTLALRLLIPRPAPFLDLSHHLLVRRGSPTTLAPSPVAPGRL